MATKKILIVEDEADIAKLLKYNLEKEGFTASVAHDGETGLKLFKKEKPDLAILDVMLPKMSGFDLCREIRSIGGTPIIMLTAKREELDRVLGLELGADDYVTKPFSVREILARIKAIFRRVDKPAHASSKDVIRCGELEVDVARYETRVKGKAVALSSKEFEFLKCLLEVEGRVLTRDALLQKVWGYEESLNIDTRTIDQHIARLRDKLGAESARVVTVKNVGYRFKFD